MKLIFLFIIGSILGSFISLVIQRNQRNESIVFPNSHCDECLTPLHWHDLVPIISYFTLKQKCRYCKQQINPESTINESIMGSLFVIQTIVNFNGYIFSSLIMLTVLSTIDIQKLMVPTKLIILLLINNSLYYFTNIHGTIKYFILIFVIYLLATIINHYLIQIGAGDIDVMFITVLVIGISNLLIFIIIASITAILFMLMTNRRQKIAFIPFLSFSYLICLLIM